MASLEKMTKDQFDRYSKFSFEEFILETSKSSGQSIKELKKKFGSPPEKPSQNDLWYVIKSEDQDVGFLWVQIQPENQEAFIYDIYIEPSYRSKGIGREVMKTCIDLLKAYPIVEGLKLCVFQDNTIARKLYSSLGFQEVHFSPERRQYTLELRL